jgi:hypothetical protein
MATWTHQTHVAGLPDEVLALLTAPDAIARWSPVEFELECFRGARLHAGDRVRVRGLLAGSRVEFDVLVAEAADGRLHLTATGPIRLDVEYRAVARDGGTALRASVAVSGQGLIGRVLARATDAMLAAGALRTALGRMARELEPALAA